MSRLDIATYRKGGGTRIGPGGGGPESWAGLLSFLFQNQEAAGTKELGVVRSSPEDPWEPWHDT